MQPMADPTFREVRSNRGRSYPAASFMISAIADSTSRATPERDGSLNICQHRRLERFEHDIVPVRI